MGITRETESTFQRAVIQFAELHHWKTFHVYDSRRCNAGFPDLVFVRGSVVVFAELKTDKGKERPDQTRWLDALEVVEKAVPENVKVFLWRPSNWSEIQKILGEAA